MAALLLAGCEPGRQATEPPQRYQGDNVAVLTFSASAPADCAGGSREFGVTVEACTRGNLVTVPNPCAWPGSDPYAQLLCHELGHVNGWPSNHPRS